MADLERLPYVTVTAESNSRAYSPLRCQAEGRPWPRSPTGAEATSQSQPTDNVPGAKRGRTPSPGPSISAALHLTLAKLPKDPSYGWTIGRCSESCDIVLAEDWNADSGVSQQQLGIAWNWKQKSLILHVKSRNGVSVMHSNSDYVRHGKGYQMWLSTSGKTRVSFGENYRLSFEISDVFAEEGPTRDAMWARAFSTCQTIPPMPGSLRLDAGKDTRLNPSILLSQEFRRSKKLGFGHSSDVYVVHDHISGAAYAMKVFRGGFQGGDEAAGKIIRKEIKMMSCLNHDNILKLEHYWAEDGTMLLQLMTGNLELAHKQIPFEAIEVVSIMEQCLSALDYLHGRKIIHRDIKPQNILFSERKPIQVKLADFGLSKVVSSQPARSYLGTRPWLAPEVTEHGNEYDGKTDIWSLGLVGYYYFSPRSPRTIMARKEFNPAELYNYVEGRIFKLSLSPSPAACLVADMLQADPVSRPSAELCLQQRCFAAKYPSAAEAASVWIEIEDLQHDLVGADASGDMTSLMSASFEAREADVSDTVSHSIPSYPCSSISAEGNPVDQGLNGSTSVRSEDPRRLKRTRLV